METTSYAKLFNAITEVIALLQKAQLECEESYMERGSKKDIDGE